MQLFYVVFIYIIPVTISFSHTKFLGHFEDQQFTTLEHHKDVMVNKNYYECTSSNYYTSVLGIHKESSLLRPCYHMK